VIAQPGGAATDDFRIVRVCDPSETVTSGRRSCLVDSACGDGGTNACIRDFAISPFSDPSGAPQFLSDAGWALAPSAACEILRGGTWLGDAGTPTDVNGATWTDKDAGFPSSGMTVGAVNDTRYCP
jgi:hypothetical protein